MVIWDEKTFKKDNMSNIIGLRNINFSRMIIIIRTYSKEKI